MNQLDRIEAKLDVVLGLLAIEPNFIGAPHTKNPRRDWGKATELRQKIIEKLKPIYENSNNTTRKQDRVSR